MAGLKIVREVSFRLDRPAEPGCGRYNDDVEDQPHFGQRTDRAEYFLEQVATQPLISECVYRSPQRTDKTQKEVVDLLLALQGRAILISLKCQQESGSRSVEKEALWVVKAARRAASQIKGALRTLKAGPVWCVHPRRGRVQFVPGELFPIHGVVLVETLEPIALPPELPLHQDGVPTSYMSVNDFHNVVRELRTIPEIEAYLDARRALPLDALRLVGQEKPLYEYYLLHEETFSGCLGQDDARLISSARACELRGALERKAERDVYAGLVERVADCLAERSPQYMEGVGQGYQAHFDSSGARKSYLRMQEELCNLPLAARALLGRRFAGLIDEAERAEPSTMTYASVLDDGKPDFVYVLASARGESRTELLERARTLLLGSMAFYGRCRGMAIVDRDSVGFEVVLVDVRRHSIAAFHYGDQHFGRLRTDHVPATLVPRSSGHNTEG